MFSLIDTATWEKFLAKAVITGPAVALVLCNGLTYSMSVNLQRGIIGSFRKRMFASMKESYINHVEVDSFERNWRMIGRFGLFTTSLSAVSHLLDGAPGLAIIPIAYSYFMYRRGLPYWKQSSIVWAYVLLLSLNVASLSLIEDNTKFMLSTRRIAMRICVFDLSTFESAGVSFLHMLALTHLLWIRGLPMWIPLQIFIFAIVPIHLFGLRELLCARALPNFARGFDNISMFALLAPIFTLAFILTPTSQIPSELNTTLIGGKLLTPTRLVAILLAILFIACVKFGRTLDRLIMPTYLSYLEKGSSEDDTVVDEVWEDFVSWFVWCASLTIYISAVGFIAFDPCFSITLTLTPVTFGVGLCALLIIVWFSYKFSTIAKSETKRRRFLSFIVHVAALVSCLLLPQCKSHVVALTTCRIMFSLEKRRFSLMQRKNALCGALTLFMTTGPTTSLVTMLVSVTAILVGTISCLSREALTKIMQKERDVQSFIHHVMKQKFASVGGAIESIVDSSSEIISHDSIVLLEKALRECRRGHDECTAANVAQAIKNNKFNFKKQKRRLAVVLAEWQSVSMFEVKEIEFTGREKNAKIMLSLDWDLLRLALTTWIRDADRLLVCYRDKEELRFTLRGRHRPGTCNKVFSEALGGFFSKDGLSLVLRASQSSEDEDPTPSSSQIPVKGLTPISLARRLDERIDFDEASVGTSPNTKSSRISRADAASVSSLSMNGLNNNKRITTPGSGKLPGGDGLDDLLKSSIIPQSLVYAVIDDNKLARKNLERIISRTLMGRAESFFRGETRDDCLFFPHEIVFRCVDVAIFDECLDFDGDDNDTAPLSGTQLAGLAKSQGFKGCTVLHSAHAHISSKFQSSIFDGYIEKTASKGEFIRGLEEAWLAYLSRIEIEQGSSSETIETRT